MPSNKLTPDPKLLDRLTLLLQLEARLTATLDKAAQWLPDVPSPAPHRSRVRPLPTTMEQVHQVLAVARQWAPRTSAPAGWNVNAPVVGFTTPNPLPHQLRGGVLANLQLEREREKKRQKTQELQEKQRKKVKEEQANKSLAVAAAAAATQEQDTAQGAPVPRDAKQREKQMMEQRGGGGEESASPRAIRKMSIIRQQENAPQMPAITMNLSESSSSDNEDESE